MSVCVFLILRWWNYYPSLFFVTKQMAFFQIIYFQIISAFTLGSHENGSFPNCHTNTKIVSWGTDDPALFHNIDEVRIWNQSKYTIGI